MRERIRKGAGRQALQTSTLANSPLDWREERLRYQVLRFVYDHVGADCAAILMSAEIQGALALSGDEVQRVLQWLQQRGYVRCAGLRPGISLTTQAIEYLENAARRRQSLRH